MTTGVADVLEYNNVLNQLKEDKSKNVPPSLYL